ncbi:MAG: DNA polymerase III subunit alpha, partial [Heliobacteriaceae bacterium]|nr:DNA polymerase III subunit alpha [Heliobacteriaceae bacterium]
HAAGVVIAPAQLVDFLPVQKSTEGGVVTQFPKDTVEEIGLLKMDLLGLKTLTLIQDALNQVHRNYGEAPVLSHLPLDDEATYQLLSRADTLGVFQLEGRGLRALLKELRPSVFDDIIALVALYRPGPLQSGMVEDFIRRKHGQTAVTFQHPTLEPILKDTYGVILYQEQVMRIASELAGFSLGEADLLRRAMGKKKPEVIAGLQAQFVAGAQNRGIPAAVAGQVFELMEYFAGYGFNKSHSAAYALIAYQTAYLKAHYPAEFMAALLTSVADTTDKVAQYIEECRRLGLPVLPPDINESAMDFTVVTGPRIRFGLAAVKNVGKAAIEAIVFARETGGPFRSLQEFCTRVDSRQVNRRAIDSLIRAGAMVSLGGGRRPLLLALDKCLELAARRQRDLASGQLNLFDVGVGSSGKETSVLDQGSPLAGADLPLPDVADFCSRELLAMEKELLGFYFSGHPLEEFRRFLERKTSMAIVQITRRLDRQRLILGGIGHQLRPFTTKLGEVMASFSLEDWAGTIKVLVFPRVYARWGSQLQDDLVVLVEGTVHCQDDRNEFFADQLTVVPGRQKTGTSEHLGPELPRLAVIKLPFASSNEMVVGSLLRLLQAYPGDIPVQVCFLGDRRAFSLANGYWVSGALELAVALREQFGLETVRAGPEVHFFSPGKT